MDWPFAPLPPLSFDLIMADPPWQYKNYSRKGEHKGAAAQYDCMSLDQIKALPVGQLASPDSLLVLWATNPLLSRAFDVMESWGFAFKTAGHWVKKTKNGKLGFGTGYLLRAAGEPFLLGTIGRPKVTRSSRSIIEGLIREHSRKPEEAYAWAERLMPNARRVELFSRQARPGWTAWGNQTDKFGRVGERTDDPHDQRSPEPYNARKDFAGSLDDAYASIRDRVAAGGPGWEPNQ